MNGKAARRCPATHTAIAIQKLGLGRSVGCRDRERKECGHRIKQVASLHDCHAFCVL